MLLFTLFYICHAFLIFSINQNFTVRPEPKVASFTPVSIPQSNAFVDVTGDMHAGR